VGVGCATLVSGTSDDVTIGSRPSGARVIVQPLLRDRPDRGAARARGELPVSAGRALVLLAAGALVACAKPVSIRIQPSGPASAQLDYRRIDGAGGPAPARECRTPCSVTFEPDSVYELELRAPGYQRALLAVEYQPMLLYGRRTDGSEPTLVIPMLEAGQGYHPGREGEDP
jgi:hypothetical protein